VGSAKAGNAPGAASVDFVRAVSDGAGTTTVPPKGSIVYEVQGSTVSKLDQTVTNIGSSAEQEKLQKIQNAKQEQMKKIQRIRLPYLYVAP
jgi:hypothetical protein